MYSRMLLPLTIMLSACTSDLAMTDSGVRRGVCTPGGPATVAQNLYDLRTEDLTPGLPNQQLLDKYQPFLSDSLYQSLAKANNIDFRSATWRNGDLFSGAADAPTQVKADSAPDISRSSVRNVPLRVTMSHADKTWQDEVLMVREGECWAVDDIRYLATWVGGADGATLKQALEK